MKICEFVLERPFLKVYEWEMAATVITVEFGTIHHCTSLEENSNS